MSDENIRINMSVDFHFEEFERRFSVLLEAATAKMDCQDEPRLIATTPEEADEIIDMWEAGL